jgi:hypothetical protein
MNFYIVESNEPAIEHDGQFLDGVRAEYPGRVSPLFLYVLPIVQALETFVISPNGRASSRKRWAPAGEARWWIVLGGSSAMWPVIKLRSTGVPLTAEQMELVRADEEYLLSETTVDPVDAEPTVEAVTAPAVPPANQRHSGCGTDLLSRLEGIVRVSFDEFPPELPARLQEEIESINDAARWTWSFAQVAHVRPKFFGGHPDSIRAGEYILSISLNHKFVDSNLPVPEYVALNASVESHMRACCEYFRAQHPYYYARFFNRRATVVAAFLEHAQIQNVPDSRELLENHSFYLERYPTWSPNSRAAREPLQSPILDWNSAAWDSVLELCPPRAILLAGAANAESLMSRGVREEDWAQWNIRPTAHRCIVGIAHASLCGRSIPVVRCNFLGRVYGPNSHAELKQIGQALATGRPGDAWVPWSETRSA